MWKGPCKTVGKTTLVASVLLLFSICWLTPVFSVLGVSGAVGSHLHAALCSSCLPGLLLPLLQELLGPPRALHLTFKPSSSGSLCCLPGMAFLDFSAGGEALPGVVLGEVPSYTLFPRAPRKVWDVVPSIGMMPLDEGGSETESLYEIEGMNKWILYL